MRKRPEERVEIRFIQRTDLKPETLGLTLGEAKMILKELQQIVVECQGLSFLLPKRLVLIAASRVALRVITRSWSAPIREKSIQTPP
jgi:hypothetical protein